MKNIISCLGLTKVEKVFNRVQGTRLEGSYKIQFFSMCCHTHSYFSFLDMCSQICRITVLPLGDSYSLGSNAQTFWFQELPYCFIRTFTLHLTTLVYWGYSWHSDNKLTCHLTNVTINRRMPLLRKIRPWILAKLNIPIQSSLAHPHT